MKTLVIWLLYIFLMILTTGECKKNSTSTPSPDPTDPAPNLDPFPNEQEMELENELEAELEEKNPKQTNTSTEDQSHTILEIEKILKEQKIKEGEMNYYILTMNEGNYKKDKDLIFELTLSGNTLSDPDIFISTKEQKPNYSKSQWQCAAWGEEICPIPAQNITASSKFYIGVYCFRNCTYNLEVTLASEIWLEDGRSKIDFLGENGTAIYKFRLPMSTKASRMSVLLDIDSLAKNTFRMYFANTGENESKELPSADNTLGVMSTFFGYAGEIYSKSDHFCAGCVYKILVETSVEGSFKVTFKTDEEVHTLPVNNSYVRDIVGYNEHNCYKYEVLEGEAPMNIFLIPYSGDPDLFVNPDSIPMNNLHSAKFISTGSHYENLEISAEERKRENALTGTYMICVYGSLRSSYEMLITNMNDWEHIIVDGLTNTMEAKEGKLVTFRYEPRSDAQLKIILTVAAELGEVDYVVKKCMTDYDDYGKDITPCSISDNDISDPQSGGKSIIEYSEPGRARNGGIFTQKKDDCEQERCYYLIGVIGRNPHTHFSITLAEEALTETILREGNAYEGYLAFGSSQLFKFSVTDPSVENVQIQLTSLSGDADLRVSVGKEGEKVRDKNKSSYRPGNIADIVEYNMEKDGDLVNEYHINVTSYTQAYFTLTYTLTRNSTNETSTTTSIITLLEGRPQRVDMSHIDEQIFRFDVQFPKDADEDIRIELVEESGSFGMYVSYGNIPSTRLFDWEAVFWADDIHIRSSHQKYISSGTYYILVVKNGFWFYDDDEDNNEDYQELYTFSIRYVTGNSAIQLIPGTPHTGTIDRKPNYYKYLVTDFTTQEISVSVTPFSGDPDLAISFDPKNQLPTDSEGSYNRISTNIGADTITFKLEDVQRVNSKCKGGMDERGVEVKCEIYISVYSDEACSYSVQVKTNAKVLASHLFEGQPQHSDVKHDEPTTFYFIPKMGNDYIITIATSVGSVVGYVNLIKNASETPLRDWPIPTKSHRNKESSLRVKDQIIKISEEENVGCGGDCVYYIAINQDENISLERSQFTITVGGQYRQLSEGVSVVDNVQTNGTNYYTFDVKCEHCTLTLSLTPISAGDPDLYVAKDPRERPTKPEDYNFFSSSLSGEYLQIDENNSYFGDIKNIKGKYVIGVFGFESCTYSLVVTTSVQTMHYLDKGIPFSMKQEEKPENFIFYQWSNESFTILLTVRSGEIKGIYVNVITNPHTVDLLNAMPTPANNTWNSAYSVEGTSEVRTSLTIDKTDPKFSLGYYLISVISHAEASYTILVDSANENEISFLRVGEPFEKVIGSDAKVVYGFRVEHNVTHHIYVKNIYGKVDAWVDKDPTADIKDAIYILDSGHITIHKEDPRFNIGENYYIMIKSEDGKEAQIYISITMEDGLIWLKEGYPQEYHLAGDDTIAYFAYECPRPKNKTDLSNGKEEDRESSDAVFQFSLTSHTQHFQPILYISKAEKSKKSEIIYPNSTHHHEKYGEWRPRSNHISEIYQFDSSKTNILIIGVQANFIENIEKIDLGNGTMERVGKFELTAWSSAPVILTDENIISDTIYTTNGFSIYQITLSKKQQLEVEVSPCLGKLSLYLRKDRGLPENKNDIWEGNITKAGEITRGFLFITEELERGTYYAMVEANILHPIPEGSWMYDKRPRPGGRKAKKGGNRNENRVNRNENINTTQNITKDITQEEQIMASNYLIRIKLREEGKEYPLDKYSLGKEGKLTFNAVNGDVELAFQPALYLDDQGKFTQVGSNQVEYEIFSTTDSQINMDTLCGLGHADLVPLMDTQEHISNLTTGNISSDIYPSIVNRFRLPLGTHYINVLAKLLDVGEYLAYQSIDVVITKISSASSSKPQSKKQFYFMVIGFTCAIIIACIFYLQLRRTQKRLQYEMSDVRNIASVRSIDIPMTEKKTSYKGLMSTDDDNN